jgi:hypothetical protein
MKSN